MVVCPLDLNFLHKSSQKWLVFANFSVFPNFLPQLANFFTRIYPSYPWHFPTLVRLGGDDDEGDDGDDDEDGYDDFGSVAVWLQV